MKIGTRTGRFSAAILAGGQARRFGGRDKGALLVGATQILERQIALLREVAKHVIIVSNDRERYRTHGVPVVADQIAGAGALGGIYTAIQAGGQHTLVVACDMPFLSASFLRYLASRHLAAVAGETDVAIPRIGDRYEPLCACYSRTCSEAIRRRIRAGSLKVTDFLADVRVREIAADEVAPYDPQGILFFNINTPEDYQRALALVSR